MFGGMSDPGEPPSPPAMGWHEMVAVLPVSYHLAPPPPSGISMEVKGIDKVSTTWRLPEDLALHITDVLMSRPVRVKQRPYNDRE